MKLLIITPYFPYPINSGGNNAQFFMIDYLRSKIEITLLCPIAFERDYKQFKNEFDNIDVHVVEFHPERSGKNKLLFYLMNPLAFVKNGFFFIKEHFRNVKQQDIPLKTKMTYLNIDKQQNFSANFINHLSYLIQKKIFDIVQIEFALLLPLGLCLPGNIKKIFVHHEIGFIRTKRELETLSEIEPYDSFIVNNLKLKELSYLKLYDIILTFSHIDNLILKSYLTNNVLTSPFSISEQIMIHDKIGKIRNLLFLGGENHYPNRDAIEWFVKTFFAKIVKEYPFIKLKIIGNWSIRTIRKYQNNESISFLGYVNDLKTIIQDCAMIVPLRIGSGIRAKILEAFALGVPVISSTIGIEGIPAQIDRHFLKADTEEDYIRIIGKLINNPEFANEMTKTAREEILPIYQLERCGKLRYDIYQELLNKEI